MEDIVREFLGLLEFCVDLNETKEALYSLGLVIGVYYTYRRYDNYPVFFRTKRRQMELLGATTGPDWNSSVNRGDDQTLPRYLSSISGERSTTHSHVILNDDACSLSGNSNMR